MPSKSIHLNPPYSRQLRTVQTTHMLITLARALADALNSAIVKLSKLTVAQPVYRGVTGARLPESFRQPNEFNVRGGIDSAFMSTTLDRSVALEYAAKSGGSAGVVFCMRQGMVNRGADISWLSQYPHEKECAPLPPQIWSTLSRRLQHMLTRTVWWQDSICAVVRA